MIPTILDTKTGEIKKATLFDYSPYWWADGNGSCDCNRSIVFDLHDELENENGAGICFGAKRFLIIKIDGDSEGYSLEDFNDEYDYELISKFIF